MAEDIPSASFACLEAMPALDEWLRAQALLQRAQRAKLDKKKTKLKKEKKKHRILQNDEKLASKSIKEVSDDSD